jgi:DNA-binding NarL/FixJ family response regulator
LQLLREGNNGVGYLLKDRVGNIAELTDAIRRVATGGSVVDAEVVDELFGERRAGDRLDRLTARECEILGLMAQGLSNAAICDRLFISPKTIERHISSLFTKLELPPSVEENRRVVAVLHYLRGDRDN